MNTILVWLLVSLPPGGSFGGSPTPPVTTIAQFADGAECRRLRQELAEATYANTNLRCVQARVAKG